MRENRRGLNWTEYLLEGWALGLFMLSACGFSVLLFHPASPVVRALPDELSRRVLMGVAMGGTAILNIYSPWGRRSGAQMNPAVTLTFFRMGRMPVRDAAGYIAGQFAGGLLGVAASAVPLARWIGDPAVSYAVTVPGPWGIAAAWAGELAISFALMLMVLTVASRPRFAPWTGVLAGLLVAVYIVLESPVSGMSMNPARTLASALPAMRWTALWVYFTAPLAGMLLAVELTRLLGERAERVCGKMHHDAAYRCLFCEHLRQARAPRGG
ncbi:MAG TPA: aquaporin [Gemmatimonadales bacterium]|nr:aquaporin [Gemmatimonadales bacterium]